ncbi:hypothetical protein [Candidatus Magnetominusculus xianensis]|uniref:Lipoprotein n=1 Tax=Candidatus Magnetominusculus xianensis TaxID=1748249 RepID=A0ABR5SFQ9_9BACT|nr:hypothetical protein [Candidatus Magnetominusculus xianensis]KWT77345.1 hypothetical protein ASN18_3040 [Candidatus Magnetominusculus xianensis]MBF0404972.1 hypothetical protein [Nitrospirota bacterium]
MGKDTKVKTSTTISFAMSCSSSSESFKVEGDSDMNVDESGNARTCFKYGELYYFRVYKTSKIEAYTITASDGTVTKKGTGKSSSHEETIKFEKTDKASVSYPIGTLSSVTWKGTNLGAVKQSGDLEVTAETAGVAIALIAYNAQYDLWSISVNTKDDDTYEVLVYIEEK